MAYAYAMSNKHMHAYSNIICCIYPVEPPSSLILPPSSSTIFRFQFHIAPKLTNKIPA